MKEYGVLLPVVLKDNVSKNVDMSKYQKDGKFVIPDVAKVTAVKPDNSRDEKDTNKVEVNYEEDLAPQKTVNVENVTAIQENGGSFTDTIEKKCS